MFTKKMLKFFTSPRLFFVDAIRNIASQVYEEKNKPVIVKKLKIAGLSGSTNSIHGKVSGLSGFSTIKFRGGNNTLVIGKNVRLCDCEIVFTSSNAVIEIHDNVTLMGTVRVNRDCSIIIGEDTKFNKPSRIHAGESSNVIIGSNCLFANVNIRTSDSHSIIDMSTNERINPAEDIIIGDHVWIAENVSIYKGVGIGFGSIIGAGSIVTRDIPENSMAVGVPAKVVKINVMWEE